MNEQARPLEFASTEELIEELMAREPSGVLVLDSGRPSWWGGIVTIGLVTLLKRQIEDHMFACVSGEFDEEESE